MSLVNHGCHCVRDAVEQSGANAREDGATENHRVADLGERDRYATDVSVHLHQLGTVGEAACRYERFDLEARCVHRPQDVRGSVADSLLDRPVHMLGRVMNAQSPDDAAG